ncbi:hypothetical protein D1R32_gp061 [Tunisvirus fontaine2]|uniref:Uncharacterized protein n=1 Tax=Tunisvirus fontaine2 TaxID=1421067 RepID=V9SD26_9VIRU|nr:hypothetical protein D1R32_gp061 [Tunisvirus fontaine2]AHC54778.1 hypothetical protein TNS_ORF60 [Tunisvirus fontaine2]
MRKYFYCPTKEMGQELEKPTESRFDWEENVNVWKKNYGSSGLKTAICLSQFGEERDDCKLIWLRVYGKLFPIVVTPETSMLFLEKNLLPKLWNRMSGDDDGLVAKKVGLHKISEFPEDTFCKNIWEDSEDGDKYTLRVKKIGNATCPCCHNKKYL